MGKAIIKIKDKYFEFSTIVDAPVTYGMNEEELRNYIKDEYGNEGLKNLGDRLKRVEKNGTSFHGEDLESTLIVNRAGCNEERLTEDEIYDMYKTPKAYLRAREKCQ